MNRSSRLLCFLLACCSMLVTLPAPVLAQSDGTPARSTIRFEAGPDGAPIADSLPGLRFTASDGAEWTYGDVRSGRYNAPYPLPCPAFGGTCAFAVAGNGFAWLGETAGSGRIDLLDPTITYVSAGFSTAEPLTVGAFTADGTPVGEQMIDPNLATGRLDPATFTASPGGSIAYLLIRGGANRWIMDNLTIGSAELPPRPGEPPAERLGEPAFVTVVQQPAPNRTAAPDSRVRLTIEVVNRGRGAAQDAVVTLELNPQVVRVLDAQFTTSAAWVSALTPTLITMRTGALPAEAVVTIMLELYVLPTAPLDAPIGGALTARWSDSATGGVRTANLPLLVVGALSSSSVTLPMQVALESSETAMLTAAGFAPDEPVGIWYDDAAGTVTPLTTVRAGAEGALAVGVSAAAVAPGGFFVAEGHWSGLSAASAPLALSDR